MLLAQSFAKNFGLYGERVGTFSITCDTPEAVKVQPRHRRDIAEMWPR